ncbi:MAG: tRNA 2-thiouridine(34) synthase MnmA [Phycisphaerae bacterium]|nr:tRNA 2-thiouridine(34) synthase MnmA [Phycisphaerae bacterium]
MGTASGKNRAIVALSGGVDSAAAAVLLCQAGLEVTGVYICLQQEHGETAGGRKSCCSPQDAADAAAIASRLGIDFQVVDGNDEMTRIKDAFAQAYADGRTPNPCIVCNQLIKFGKLFEIADEIEAYSIATGHYAQIVGEDGHAALHRAMAKDKDQSYVLFGIDRSRLGRVRFPLGRLSSKEQARAIVKDAGLSVHDKPDSQEICFVPDGDYRAILKGRAERALRPGPILDEAGKVLGTHDGCGLFTIGQRRGIRIAAAEPLYVLSIDPQQRSITIGPKVSLACCGLRAGGANWLADVPETFDCTIQIRYNHRGAAGTVRRLDDECFEVAFDEPVDAVTPGQAAVLYDGDKVLGGGWIDSAVK